MDIGLGKFTVDFVMIILLLAITFLIIANRLDGLDEEIKELKNSINELKSKKDYV